MPAFNITPIPHPNDEAYQRSEGENFYDGKTPINADHSFHDSFDWERVRK